MKQLAVEVRVRNNLLLERRQKLCLTQMQMATLIGIPLFTYVSLEGLKKSPRVKKQIPGCCAPGCAVQNLAYPPASRLCRQHIGTADEVATMWRKQAWEAGDWCSAARKIADYFNVLPEDLWPDEVTSIDNPTASRKMDVSEVVGLIGSMPEPPLLPSEYIEHKEDAQSLEAALKMLNPQQEKVLRERFGIGVEEKSSKEVADDMGVTRSRVGEVEARALMEMRSKLKVQQGKKVVWQPTCPGCGQINPVDHHAVQQDGIWTCRKYRTTCPGCGRVVTSLKNHHPRKQNDGTWICVRSSK